MVTISPDRVVGQVIWERSDNLGLSVLKRPDCALADGAFRNPNNVLPELGDG